MNDRDRDGRADRPRRSSGQPSRDGAERGGGFSGDRGSRRDGQGADGRQPRRDGAGSYDRKPRRDGESSYVRGPRQGERDRGFDRKPPRRGGEGGYDRAPRRDGDRSQDRRPRRDGESGYDRRPRRDGEGGYDRKPRRDGGSGYDRKPRRDGDGDRNRGPRREGERSFDRGPRREGDRPQFGRGGTRGGGRSDRGGQGREFTAAERLQHELRPVRSEHDDPFIPEDVTPNDLHPGARNELKTLQPETAERVAQHLAMVGMLIGDNPQLAHQHAISASRRAGRIPVARETLAVTAYHIGDYALALRELRTFRRLTGSQGHLALMVECERALGRPERGIETGLAAELAELNTEQRVQLAIAMSGARLDLGQTQQALFELEIPELDPSKAFSWSPELFAAYANVLEDLGRDAESAKWRERALLAESALSEHLGGHDQIEVIEVYEHAPREEYNDTDASQLHGDATENAETPKNADAADSSEKPESPLEPAGGE